MYKAAAWLRYGYLLGFGMVAVGLPWSRQLLSLAMPVLGLIWLASCYVQRKPAGWNRFWIKPPAIAALAFLPYLLGMLYTTDLVWGWKLVALVLPLLLYPFFFSVTPQLKERDRTNLLLLFLAATVLVTVASVVISSGTSPYDFRDRSPIISHIRLALMTCLGVCIGVWYIGSKSESWRWALVLPVIWLLYFLSVVKSLQGILILLLVLAYVLWKGAVPKISKMLQRAALLFVVSIFTGVLLNAYNAYFSAEQLSQADKQAITIAGEKYNHGPADQHAERGNYVWHFVAPNELARAWNERSEIPFTGNDLRGNEIKHTLCRYLNSLGYRKDAEAVGRLTANDRHRIEQGIPWFDMGLRNGFAERLDMLFFELDAYFHREHVVGSSLAMRLVYWKLGWNIFSSSPWIGVGTGDTQLAYDAAYDALLVPLPDHLHFRAHQQWLTWAISWGVVGFVFILLVLAYPVRTNWSQRHPLAVPFLIILGISFLTDDTLERQMGVTLFAFFYCLLILSRPAQELTSTP